MEAMLLWNYPLNMTLLINLFAGTCVWNKVVRWPTISVHFEKKRTWNFALSISVEVQLKSRTISTFVETHILQSIVLFVKLIVDEC